MVLLGWEAVGGEREPDVPNATCGTTASILGR
jgi:hypothetical protein